MIKPLATRFLQNITSQNEWSRPHLLPFAGKVIAFDFVLLKTNVQILEDGSLAIAADTTGLQSTSPQASIHAPPSLMLRILSGDESAKMHIKIDGDAHLATEFSKVLQNMRWDVQEDLSHMTGDIAAFKIGELTKKSFNAMRQQSIHAAEMLSEYWQEENTLLAKKRHVEQFISDVDALRSDVERFE